MDITALILAYRYFIIVPLTLIEGPIVMMVSGVLLGLGYFDFWILYAVLMGSDLLADIIWYWLGYHYGYRFMARYGKYVSIEEKEISAVRKLFHRYHDRILIISKLTMGFGFAVVTLFTAGLSHVPFKKYLMLNFLGQIVWTAVLMGIGYYLGNYYLRVNNIFGFVSSAAIIVLVFLALIGFGRYLKKRTMSEMS